MLKSSGLRKLRVAAILAAAALTLGGCASLPADAPIEKVDYKACLVTGEASQHVVIDALADYSVKQSVVTYGVKTEAKISSDAGFAKDVNKLAKQNCDLVVISGDQFASQIAAVVDAHKELNFVFVSTDRQVELLTADIPNLSIFSVDLFEAGLASGFVGASLSQAHHISMIQTFIGEEDYFDGIGYGARQYDSAHALTTRVSAKFGGLLSDAEIADILFLGTQGSFELETTAKLFGFGSDAYLNPTFEKFKGQIAGTVELHLSDRILEIVASDLEGDFIGGAIGSTTARFGNGGLSLAANHDIVIGDDVRGELQKLTDNYELSQG